MNKNRIVSIVAGSALAALSFACTDTATNTNTNTANLNANANANTAVVVNNNANANSAGVTVTNTNMRPNYNVTREEYDKGKDRYSKEAKDAGDTVGTGVNDGWLWVKAKAALAAVDDLRDSTINVDVDNGVVTLRGNVASADQVKKADAAAKSIEGEKSVMNKLAVAAAGSNMNMNKNMNKNMNANK